MERIEGILGYLLIKANAGLSQERMRLIKDSQHGYTFWRPEKEGILCPPSPPIKK